MKILISAFMLLATVNVFAFEPIQIGHVYQGLVYQGIEGLEGIECEVVFEKADSVLPISNKVTASIDSTDRGATSLEFSTSKMKRALKTKGYFLYSKGKRDSFWGYSYIEVKVLKIEDQTFWEVSAGHEPTNIIIGMGQHARCIISPEIE